MIKKWISPSLCDPPHKITHEDKYENLYYMFVTNGWDTTKPNLIGYHFGNKIQLISGSHRWAAALKSNILIPVQI